MAKFKPTASASAFRYSDSYPQLQKSTPFSAPPSAQKCASTPPRLKAPSDLTAAPRAQYTETLGERLAPTLRRETLPHYAARRCEPLNRRSDVQPKQYLSAP